MTDENQISTEIKPQQKRAQQMLIVVALIVTAVSIAVIGYWAIWADISPEWTGFGAYNEEVEGVRAKTLWDWMELSLVPIVLAVAGYSFAHIQKQTELEVAEKAREEDRKIAQQERDIDREIALEKQRQQAFENYLGQMKDLVLVNGLGGDEVAPEVTNLTKTLTLNILRELDSKRNAQILQFLQDLGVRLDLSWASLPNTNLRGANLCGTDLSGADLKGADLSDTDLVGAELNYADMSGANLSRGYLRETSLNEAKLNRADLRGATLNKTDLSWANLSGADLSGIYLSEVDLSGANLNGVIWDDIDLRSMLSEIKSLREATMPDGRKYEEWLQDKETQANEQPSSTEEE